MARRHRVATAVYDGLAMLEFGIATEVFGLARPEMGPDWYEFLACSVEDGPLRSESGITVTAPHGLDELATADTIVIPGWRWHDHAAPLPPFVDAVRSAHARGARIVTLCTGVFVPAAAGLLDARPATTHWLYMEELMRLHPSIDVQRNVLWVDNGDVLTSAGSAAGMDLCLHVVACDHGTAAANSVARRAVVPPHRSGGQAQYVETPVPDLDDTIPLHDVLAWMDGHLAEPMTVRDLARRAALSPRTFARRFRGATGTTPNRWLLERRLRAAQDLLETTCASVDRVAAATGFGSGENLRHHFRAQLGTSPTAYRSTFTRAAS
jgi:AraC family transcriptional activator FtrA